MLDSSSSKPVDTAVPYFPPPPTAENQQQLTNPTHSSPLLPPSCPLPSKASNATSIPVSETYYPPPPPGPPPAQTITQSANLAAIPTYNPADPPHPLKSNPSQPYNPNNATATTAATATPNAAAASVLHPNNLALPDPSVPPVKTVEQVEAETAEPQGSFAKWGKKLQVMGGRAAGPINGLAEKMGVQGFLPVALERECDKAADILESFMKTGVVAEKPASPSSSPTPTPTASPSHKKPPSKALLKIPSSLLRTAYGLVIFSALRAGFHISTSTGSGILLSRLSDGTWSPPSGIQITSLGGGFLVGLEAFDCVLVVNSKKAMEAFERTRVGLGGDVAVAAGPWGAGGGAQVGHGAGARGERKTSEGVEEVSGIKEQVAQAGRVGAGIGSPALTTPEDPALKKKTSSGALKPVLSYVKSKGFYAGVQVDGTVMVERKDANAAFYGRPIVAEKILNGVDSEGRKVEWPVGALRLKAVLDRLAPKKEELGSTGNARPAPGAVSGSVVIVGEELSAYDKMAEGYPADTKVRYQ